MRCNVCGKENPDNVDLCISCGSMLKSSARDRLKRFNRAGATEFPGYFRTAWRKFARSPLALLFVLCYSAGLVITLLEWDAYLLELDSVLMSLGVWNMNTIPSRKIILNVIHAIEILPSILMVVGIWVTGANAWTKSDQPIRLGGLTLISVVQVVNMIVLGIVFCLVLVQVRRGFLIVLALAGLVMYLNWVQLAVTLVARNTARDCMPETRYVKALAVFEFISAGVHFLRLIGGAGDELNSALNCVGTILLGALLLKYKTLMEDLDGKRVEMEAQCEKEPEQEQKANATNYVPAWKRVQMEIESSENNQ